MELKLSKRQLAVRLNVSDLTIYLWEKNRVDPSLAQVPRIIEFLGLDVKGHLILTLSGH